MNKKIPNWLDLAKAGNLTSAELRGDVEVAKFDEQRGRVEKAARKFLAALHQLKRDIDAGR